MKDKIKIVVAVELIMLLIFGVMGYTMVQTLWHKYWNDSGKIEKEYWSELCDQDSINSYCKENGIDPYYKKSPGEMLENCVESFLNSTGGGTFVEGTYIIAKCYDKNMELVAEAGDILQFSTGDEIKVKYAYPDRYFTPEQMQQIYNLEEKYGNTRVSMVEGYYENEELVLTALKVTSNNEGTPSVFIQNKTERKTIIYNDNEIDASMYGLFLRTQAAERPVSYHGPGLSGVFDYMIEKYAASRSKRIQAYNEGEYKEQILKEGENSAEWVEGTNGRTNCQEFIYQGETYYIAYSIMTDCNYVALADYSFSTIMARIFYFLQITAILFSILLYKIYQKKKRLDHTKIVLTNGVAHELKIPLAVIKNYGECIEYHVNPDKEGYYLSSILDETDRMNAMVVQLLNYTRFSNEDYKIKKELYALDELAVEVLKEKQEIITQKSLNVTFHCEGSMEAICDGPLIKMVIENYLTNAITHTPEHQNIQISVEESGSKLRRKITCRVYNQGSFISVEERKYIWDVFYRGDKARSRQANSTGFGLAICKHIIKLHKGKYGCIDKVNGIEFFFTLPIGIKGKTE